MSDLPTIDISKVAHKLTSRLSEANYQGIQLEVLAEALRDERDEALERLAEVTAERDALLEEKSSQAEGGSDGGV